MTAPYISLAPLVAWRSLPRPLDWPALFGREAPLELEIGCGNGEVLVRRAQAHPELNLIGLDEDWSSVRRGLRRINLAGAANVRLLQTEAGLALERLFASASLSRAACFFPRPWPRPRDAGRRLLSTRFLRLLGSRLAPGGSLRVLTDAHDYAAWVLEQAAGSGFRAAVRRVPPGLDSKYERKWMGQGQEEFHELTLAKTEHLDWPNPKEPKLRYPRLPRFDPARLAPFEDWGEVGVLCKDVLYDPVRGRALLRMVVLEEGLEQAFYLEVLPDQGGHLLRPAPGCGLLPSLGVQRALKVTAARLQDD